MSKTSLRVYNREIEQLIEHGRTDEAIAHCRHILQAFPKHLETHRLLGKAYLESRRYEEAVDILGRVLKSVPNDFVSHVGLSIAADERGDLDAAIWHMQRAFESQPANQAIQGELQRLFGRRDGVEPPKIRMTRGALAQMYVQGELYPQAISEIRAVLSQDPQRADLQVLLAYAYFRAGQMTEVAELCGKLLADAPYCLEANRIMAELAPSKEQNAGSQVWRRRVIELDPYAAHSEDSLAAADQVNDSAVQLERLDYGGQQAEMALPWTSALGAETESGRPAVGAAAQLKTEIGAAESTRSGPEAGAAASAEPELPDFLRQAGWLGALAGGDASVNLSMDSTNELTPAQLPAWLKDKMPVDDSGWTGQPGLGSLPQAPEGAAPQLGSDAPQGAGLAEQPQATAFQPRSVQPPSIPGEDIPSWLKDLGQGDSEQPATAAGQSKSQTVPIDWDLGDASNASGMAFPGAASRAALGPTDESPGWFAALVGGNQAKSEDPAQASPAWARPPLDGLESLRHEVGSRSLGEEPLVNESLSGSAPAGWLRGLQHEPTTDDHRDMAAGSETDSSLREQDGPTWLHPPGADGADSLGQQAAVGDAAWTKGLSATTEEPSPVAQEPLQDSAGSPDSEPDGMPSWLNSPPLRGEQLSARGADDRSADSQLHGKPPPTRHVPATPQDRDQLAASEKRGTDIPNWLRGLEEPGIAHLGSASADAPPEWLDAEAHEPFAEPTAPSDWRPAEQLSSPITSSTPHPDDLGMPPRQANAAGAATDEAVLINARDGLQRGEIPGALATYEGLIRRGVHLEETLRDLRDATYRYPVDVNVWQTLGDAYMRANRLQEALDAYNRAEEMLR